MLTAREDQEEIIQIQTTNLADEESRISKNVLKIHDVKVWQSLSFEQKQLEFKETCFAILNIVNLKLYRSLYPSLEQYFKKKWSVSRAQVYRLYESAAVLKIIEPVCTVVPFKERHCRQLKNCVGLDREELINLWKLALKATGSVESKLSTFGIQDYFVNTLNRDALKNTSLPKKSPKKVTAGKLSLKKINDNSDTDYSDTEYPVVTKRSRPAAKAGEQFVEATTVPDSSLPPQQPLQKRHRVGGGIDDRLLYATGLERDYLEFQNSISSLNQHGYALESLVNGHWERPKLYKLNTILDLDILEDIQNSAPSSCGGETVYNGLDTLLLVAESTLR